MQNKYKLHYSVRLSTDVSFPADVFADFPGCIPGREMRRAMESRGSCGSEPGLSALTFSFAYIGSGGKRCLPSPISFAFVRNAPAQLRDRMATDQNTDLFERLHYLPRCFVTDPNADSIESVPVKKKTANNQIILSAGQSFIGFIEGAREPIERIADMVRKDSALALGGGSTEVDVLSVTEDAFETELCSDVTVRVLSPLLFRNPYGVYDETEQPIIRAMERILGTAGVFSVKSRYRETCLMHVDGFPASYGTAAGSSFRLVCEEKQDIAKIRHCFIGCGTTDGYGEITVEPTKNLYCRTLSDKREGAE